MNRLLQTSLLLAGLPVMLLLGGCPSVAVRPEGDLPKPLIVPTPAKVGVVVTPEAGNYTHKESRASVDYEAQLGPSHRHIVEEIFRAEFREAKFFEDLDAARKEPGIQAIFEPRIEQYSFASAKETGGAYCAVTIRYQIFIYAPDGQQVDMLTLTGYGSGPAPKIGNGEEELAIASYAAMRDAAAKFLVQFPEQSVGERLARNEAVTVETKVASSDAGGIETVPIEETSTTVDASPVIGPTAPGAQPVPPPPAANAPKQSIAGVSP